MIFSSRWWTCERSQHDRFRARETRCRRRRDRRQPEEREPSRPGPALPPSAGARPGRASRSAASSRRAWRAATCRSTCPFARQIAGAASLNRELFDLYLQAFREAAERYQIAGEPDINAALRIPGMLSAGAADRTERGPWSTRSSKSPPKPSRSSTSSASAKAPRPPRRCGCAAAISRTSSPGSKRFAPARFPAFQKRLRERLDELLSGAALDPQRLAQEAAILADRSDISEELVRLRTHAAHLATMLTGESEIGKRLDFLLQEMNRESNTILSKTGGLGDLGLTITDLALAAKSEIDKIREQSLNLE